jgi:hypothetical protein
MSELSKIIHAQSRNESPVSSVITDSNSVIIQIHESYDIRNDDINEDYVVSYENEYFLNNNNNSEENTISTIIDTQKLQQSFLQKINNNLLNTSMTTPNQGTRVDLHVIPDEYLSPPPVIEGKCVKTDSRLFHQSPEICHDGLSPTNNRSKLINAFLMTNSPLSSNTNSDSDAELSDNETTGGKIDTSASRYLIQEHVENAISKRKMHFKKISYEEIERSLSKYYDKNNKYSNEVDILITFIRGQKHLYNQSCYITQIKLYALTITALSITSLITVVTPFIQQYWWRIIFVMSGNAITTVLITILKYMRFESACNTFTLLSNHYEHYEHSLQITTNKLVFIPDEKEQTKTVLDKMQEIEFKMRETAELCPIIIPVEVQNTFPVIYQTNIFTLIKKMYTHRKTLILQLKNIKNEIRYILYKWNNFSDASEVLLDNDNNHLIETTQIQREKIRLLFLMDQKEKIKKELIEYKDNYTQIDDLFMKEIKYAETNKKWSKWLCCNTQKIQYNSYTNPVIKEHLELILS